ncbi:MAG TPA: GAF domain-containing protein [Solirubrobacteraceae bacterium]
MRVEQTNPWLAVRPVGDRLEQARALRRLHEAFQSGKDVGGRVRAVVMRSWARSADAGIDPSGHLARIVMDDREIEERWSRHPLYPVLPMLRDLLSGATSESSHMLVISDAKGVLMWIEGHHRVIEATHDMHFVCGADWSESGAGTNALGTAIAVDHPVQIFSAEHFNRIVHPWQCSGAPIHDPATGEILGVVDLTGHLRTAHPHTLALVTAAAGMAEAYLRHDQLRRDQAVREAYVERIAGVTQPTALVRPTGQVIAAVPHGWVGAGVGTVEPGAELTLADGTIADVEALDGLGAFVVWGRKTGERRPQAPAGVRLELLSDRPRILLPSGPLELSARHAEILAVLMLAGRGLTSEELTLEVYGETGKPVTLRAELSRLRRDLGGLLRARPYALAAPVTSDLHDAERLLTDDRLADALTLTGQGVLPRSRAPLIVEARESLESGLRDAIMRAGDPDLLAAWCRSSLGADDAPAARALVAILPPQDGRAAPARAHVARLVRQLRS